MAAGACRLNSTDKRQRLLVRRPLLLTGYRNQVESGRWTFDSPQRFDANATVMPFRTLREDRKFRTTAATLPFEADLPARRGPGKLAKPKRPSTRSWTAFRRTRGAGLFRGVGEIAVLVEIEGGVV